MGNNTAVSECLHGIHENISCDCLDSILTKFRAIAFKTFPLFRSTHSFIGHRFTAELVDTHAWLHIGKPSAGRKSHEKESTLIGKLQSCHLSRNMFSYCSLHRSVDIPPHSRNHRICISPCVHERLKFLFGKSHLQSTHTLERTDRTAVTESQFRNLALLAEMTVDAMLFYRNTKHLRCRTAVNVLAIGEYLHSPFLTCKPGKDSRFDCREVCYDKFPAILGNKCCTDQLRQRIRDIVIQKFQGIVVSASDKCPGIGKVRHMILRKILHLDDASGKSSGSVGTVILEHSSCPGILANRCLHSGVFLHTALGKLLT